MSESEGDHLYRFRALWYIGRGDVDGAIDLLRSRSREYPTEHYPHWQLGVNFFRKGLPAEACEECSTALRLRPDFFPAMLTLSDIYFSLGRLDEALAQLERVLQIKPENRNALFGIANIFRAQQRLDEAVATYKQLTSGKAAAAWHQAFLALGELYSQRGQLRDAIETLQELVRLNPRNRAGFLALGNYLERASRNDEARAAWSEVLAIKIAGPPDFKLPESQVRLMNEAREALARTAGRVG